MASVGAIKDLAAGASSGRASTTRVRAPHRQDRPGTARPGGRGTAYRQRTGRPARIAGARRGNYQTTAAMWIAAAVGVGTLALVSLVSNHAAAIPESTAVVWVKPGDSLAQIAAVYAPDASVSAVVDRILDLNNLPDAALRVGAPLVVPSAAG